ncbi:STAS/SEC14 domain-containing protein [Amnibacterium flavum]|uniref:STAS/SEC14 domain-containing protein n=1 Tax=Amnibacterium flavum TaxID=2173173 RepID=A0A2V1HPH8_9MICO|nr:STAS/SEC14 domain-containing protein [Amnibacterium flavum]PVZ94506.1 hypothetical protein DDQ50_12450 [Amnibacterium flavum]
MTDGDESLGLDEGALMALTYSSVEGTELVTVAYDGDLSAADVRALREHIESVVADHGAMRLLLEYGRAGSMPPSALFEDMKNAEFVRKIARAAIVTDSTWIRGVAGTMRHLVPFEVKVFSPDEHGAALEWVTD